MRTLIVDDEIESMQATRLLLNKYCPDVRLVGEASGVEEAVCAIERYKPELILLDVQMQDGTGFDLIEKIDNVVFKLIFVTSYDKFALKAFQCSALDYLLKPIEPELLIKAIFKARNTISSEYVKQQVDIFKNCKQSSRIALPTLNSLTMIDFDSIVYCESDSNYTTFVLSDGCKCLVSKTMKEYEDVFPTDSFFRIHKSYIVNLNKVVKYIKNDGGQVLLSNGAVLPVSRMRKDLLVECLKCM